MEDFTPFKLAKKLKEKGFPQKCFGKYEMQGACYFDDGRFYIGGCITEVEKAYTAPTISQVLKWLREEENIHIQIGYRPNTLWRIVVIYTNIYIGAVHTSSKYNSYEEAAIAGIEYVLDNLI